jgi:RimJ/RimL family protein N-acetyltransferase
MALVADQKPILRPLDRGDLSLIRAWHNTPDVRRETFAFPFPASIEAEEAWYDRNIASGDGRNAIFGILETASGSGIVGLVMLRNIDWISRTAWFGIFIGKTEARGKGLAREAMRAIIAFGFDNLGLNRIALEVSASNERAIALYDQMGFVREGVMRQARFIDGKFVDVVLMAALAENKK